MKREKEKIAALNNYIHETSSSGCEAVKENAFIAGFETADKTMLDRACEWLNKILYIHTEIEEDKDLCETNSTDWVTSDYDTVEEFITAFRQAMEGGAE